MWGKETAPILITVKPPSTVFWFLILSLAYRATSMLA